MRIRRAWADGKDAAAASAYLIQMPMLLRCHRCFCQEVGGWLAAIDPEESFVHREANTLLQVRSGRKAGETQCLSCKAKGNQYRMLSVGAEGEVLIIVAACSAEQYRENPRFQFISVHSLTICLVASVRSKV